MITHFPSVTRMIDKRYRWLRNEREKYLFSQYDDAEERFSKRHDIWELYRDVAELIDKCWQNGSVIINTSTYTFHQSIWNLLYADLEREGYVVDHKISGLYVSWPFRSVSNTE